MVLFSYIFITVWFSFWVGLMYSQPHRSQKQKMIWIASWSLAALAVNQLINHGAIHLLPEATDPMQHAYHVMYLFSASTLFTGLVLLIGLQLFRRVAKS